MVLKRLLAYCIDYFICSIVILIVLLTLGSSSILKTNSDYPLLIVALIYFPLFLFRMIIQFPNSHGDLSWLLVALPLAIIIETVILSLQEYFDDGKTVGKSFLQIKVSKTAFSRLFVRNLLKALSKYILYIPFLTVIFSKNKLALYDALTNTKVIDYND